jgi:hypothetical protein
MPPSNAAEVVLALEAARDDDLVGLEESRWFDAKGQPYRLDDDRQKWELAKDVSALANAEGGLILVAARTEKPETYLEERITAVVPVPGPMVDIKQHLDTIAASTFPPLAHRVEARRFERSGERVLLVLEVQALDVDQQPAIVATLASIGGTDVPTWAIARRVGSGTEWLSAA